MPLYNNLLVLASMITMYKITLQDEMKLAVSMYYSYNYLCLSSLFLYQINFWINHYNIDKHIKLRHTNGKYF